MFLVAGIVKSRAIVGLPGEESPDKLTAEDPGEIMEDRAFFEGRNWLLLDCESLSSEEDADTSDAERSRLLLIAGVTGGTPPTDERRLRRRISSMTITPSL